MAKVSVNKITPIKSVDKKIIQINGVDVEVLQYLPMNDKINFCESVMNAVLDNSSMSISRSRLLVYGKIELVNRYTNLNITDKMYEDLVKTYDLFLLNHIFEQVISAIPKEEYDSIWQLLLDEVDHYEQYMHSILGILRTISTAYDAEHLNVDELLNNLQNAANDPMIRDVLKAI